jgi:hypothetical protein
MAESEPADMRPGPVAEAAADAEPEPEAAEPEPVAQAVPETQPEAEPEAADASAGATEEQAPTVAVPAFGAGWGMSAPPTPVWAAPQKRARSWNWRRKKVLWTAAAVVAALALVAAGVVALLPGRTGNSVVAAVTCQPSHMASCLIKMPAGAVLLNDGDDSATAWPKRTTVTADLYASNVTRDAAGVGNETAAQLDSDGMDQIVHTDWNAVDGDNVDLVVLQFTSQKGAHAWNSARTAEILAAYPGQAVSIPGDSTGKAHAAVKADAKGNVAAAYSTVVGNLVLNVAYSSPKTFGAADLQNWAGTELASLKTAPAPAADPPDAAPATEQVACPRLTSCLASMPSGAEHWQSPNSGDWIRSSTLTQSQYIKLFWTDSRKLAPGVTANFTNDGVTGIAHQDWDTDGAAKQADFYLIQTITATGAATLTGTNFGEPLWDSSTGHGIEHTIPGESGVQSWYTSKADSDGFVSFYFTATLGNVIAEGWEFFDGSFDAATADRWAKAQLDRVRGSMTTAPMGLFPLTAPKLPASSQGSCAASGDCLLALPHGATDTTSTSYNVSEVVDADTYAIHDEPASSDEVNTWLGAAGLKTAEHRSWSAGGGVTADAVLLRYGKPAQAQAAAMLEYGLNAAGQRVCTDAAVPDSLCLAAPVSTTDPLQEQTIWVLAWKGDYEVSVSVTKSNTADVADAYTWAQEQLDLLPVG